MEKTYRQKLEHDLKSLINDIKKSGFDFNKNTLADLDKLSDDVIINLIDSLSTHFKTN